VGATGKERERVIVSTNIKLTEILMENVKNKC
jgi:hypothetical protein